MRVGFDIPEAMFEQLLGDIHLPDMVLVQQQVDTPPALVDIEGVVREQLRAIRAGSLLPGGSRVAVGVGSRGIGSLSRIVAALIAELRSLGCDPFIVPAMGSHGGATERGQIEVLTHLGITEDSVHAPIVSSMSTRVVAATPSGLEVHMDERALTADAIVFVGRIKPHTAYHGTHESGMAKMIAIGLGKQAGAAATHARGFGEMARMVPEMAGAALEATNIRFGLAILENAHDQPFRILAVPAPEILDREPALLEEARAAMPRLPFDRLDILVIDQIGKNISGDGADPNITGRFPTPYASGKPAVGKQVVLDLSEQSGGNANGLGTADFTTLRAASKMNLAATYPNALTSTVPGPVAVPMILPNDRMALAAAVLTCNAVDRPPEIVRIQDTLHLERFWISQALVPSDSAGAGLTVLSARHPPQFDRDGNFADLARFAEP